MKPNVEVKVFSYKKEPLSDASVTLEPRLPKEKQGKIIKLKYDKQVQVYQGSGIDAGGYILRVEAKGFESDQREVQVDPAGLKEKFILGKKGMISYYRGKMRIPFEPPKDLVAVSVKSGLSKEEEGDLLDYTSQFNLKPEKVGKPIHQSNVRVFRFPPGASEKDRQNILKNLPQHRLIRRAGPVIRIDEQTVSFLTNELVVKFKAHVTREEVPAIAKRYKLDILRLIPAAGNAYLFGTDTPASYDLLKTCAQIAKSGITEYAEPNLVTSVVLDYTPDDYLFSQQPHHPIINTEGAFDITMGSDDIIIAVVDSGCDYDHPDFDVDVAPGVPKVYEMFNFDSHTSDPTAGDHGTKSCGIAAAGGDNSEGICGVAPGVRLMPVVYPYPGTDVDYSDMYIWVAGYDPHENDPTSKPVWFPANISPGADVISNSYGIYEASLSGIMQDTLDFLTSYGRSGKGCVVVFSVGNNDDDFTDPLSGRRWAEYEKTIAVASSTISPPDASEVKVSTSNYGPALDVCAPGGGPSYSGEARSLSTDNVGSGDTAGFIGAPTLDYDDFGQTSCACPQVGGLAALILSVNPDLTWVEVRQIIRDTAVQIDPGCTDPIGQWVGGFSQWYGFGRINAQAAVQEADTYVSNRDIVVRENLADVGTVPTGSPFWDSPDIWVRNLDPAFDGPAALPANYSDPPPHQSPIAEQDNWVYVRFKNIGTDPSLDFYIRIYITHFPGFEFIYPDNFIPTIRPGDPLPSPLVTGTYLIGEVHYSELAAGSDDIVNVMWPSALIPPETVLENAITVSWHPCLLVEISPHDGPTPTGVHVWDNNNLAQKNISIEYPSEEDDTFAAAAVMGNQLNTSPYLELQVDRSEVPPQVQLYIELRDLKAKKKLRQFIRERIPTLKSKCCRFTFLEDTRLLVDCPTVKECGLILTLPAKAKLEMAGPGIHPEDPHYNFTLGNFKGHEVIWLAPRGQTRIPVFADSGTLIPVVVGGVIGIGVKPGNYNIRLIQLNPNGQPSGGVAIQLNIK